jgi:hypothetical protein
MQEEVKVMMDTRAWSLVPPPIGANIVGSKWVFKIKQKANGSLECYKACLIA